MKKRILSVILAVVMIVGMIPLGTMTAFADGVDLGEITAYHGDGAWEVYFTCSNVENFDDLGGSKLYRNGEEYNGRYNVEVDYENTFYVTFWRSDFPEGEYELRLCGECYTFSDGPTELDNYVIGFSYDGSEIRMAGEIPEPKLMYDSYKDGVMNFTVSNCESVTVTGDVTVSYAGEYSAAATVTADKSLYTVTDNTFTFRVKNADGSAIAGISDIPGAYTVKFAELTLVTEGGEAITVEFERAYYIDRQSKSYQSADSTLIFGSGTEADPYLIATDKEYDYFKKSGNKNAYWLLRADITIRSSNPDYTYYDSINQFKGCFDGAGHTINTDYPLFYEMYGTVRNLTIEGNISADTDAIGSVCQINLGTIENCVNYAGVTGTDSSYGYDYGGICGRNKGTIRNCTNFGTLNVIDRAGGICGENYGIIQNCANFGTIKSTGGSIGGVCGWNRTGNGPAKIENCISTVAVTRSGNNIGGLVGQQKGTVTNCFYNAKSTQNGAGTPLSEELMTAKSGEQGALIDILNNYTENGKYPADWLKWAKDEGGYPYLPYYVGCDAAVGGTVFVENQNPLKYNLENYFAARDTVTVKITHDKNYVVSGVKFNGTAIAPSEWKNGKYSFTMPAGNVHLTVQYHLHTFVYKGSGNVITATCLADGCPIKEKGGAHLLTLTLTENGTISEEEADAWTEAGLILPEIIYDLVKNTANITVGGESASVTLPTEALQPHSVKVICGTGTAGEGSAAYLAEVSPGTVVTVTANNYEDKTFEKWNGKVNLTDTVSNSTTFIMPNEDITVEAQYLNCYALSVFDGTTLISNPETETYPISVSIPATPEDMIFTGWTAEGINIRGKEMAEPLTFRMPSNRVMLTANFAKLHTVTVIGGTVTGGLEADGRTYVGQKITVTADANTNEVRFASWSSEDGVTFANAGNSSTTFTMIDQNVTVEALTEPSHTVTVTDGTVTAGLNNAGKAFPGDKITVKANTVDGYRFIGWTGEGIMFADPASATTTFTMLSNDVSVTANYEEIGVMIPTPSTKTYVYNGLEQTYQFDNPGDVSYYEVTGNRATNAGTYTVRAHLTKEGAFWDDRTTEDKVYTFTIKRSPINKPVAYNTQYYYSGEEREFILALNVGGKYYYYSSCYDPALYTVKGNKRTDAGTQTVSVTPTSNFCWPDGTFTPVEFQFTVERYPVPKPIADPRSFTDDGKPWKYTPYVEIGGKAYDMDGVFYKLTGRTQTNAGTYTVTAEPLPNFCWSDGSTEKINFTFKIAGKKLSTKIYYLKDLDEGNVITNYVKLSSIGFDDFHRGTKEVYLGDHYQPFIVDVPKGAKYTLYITENPSYNNLSELVKRSKSWDYVQMKDLNPNTQYYIFALITGSEFQTVQVTDITATSSFITSPKPTVEVSSYQEMTETQMKGVDSGTRMMLKAGGTISGMLSIFSKTKTTKTYEVLVKTEYFTDLKSGIRQAIYDIEKEGLVAASVHYTENGQEYGYKVTQSNISIFKAMIGLQSNAKIYASLRRLAANAAPAEEDSLIEVTETPGIPVDLTPVVLENMERQQTQDEPQVELRELDKFEFNIPKDFQADIKIEEETETLKQVLDRMELSEKEATSYEISIENVLYDPGNTDESKDGLVWQAPSKTVVPSGDKLPQNAIAEINGYTFYGLFYKIVSTDEEERLAENNADAGLVLTQELVKWNPETDIVKRDTELLAVYIKNGTKEAVECRTDVELRMSAGNAAVVELPDITEGMYYGAVTNDHDNITVSQVEDGKVTITTTGNLSSLEPFTFTVRIGSVEYPEFGYDIIVTVNPVIDHELCYEYYLTTAAPKADGTVGQYNQRSYYIGGNQEKVILDKKLSEEDWTCGFEQWYLRSMIQYKTVEDGAKLDIRFISMLNGECLKGGTFADYEYAGFTVTVGSESTEIKTTVGYTSFLADGKEIKIADYSDNPNGKDFFFLANTTFTTAEINPDTEISVTPFVKLMGSDTTLQGNTASFTLSQLIKN